MEISPQALLNLPDDVLEDALAEYQAARHQMRLRRDFGAFCRAVLAEVGTEPAAHHRLMIAELQRVASDPDARLMLFLPPGSAKSTYASVLFPAWFLAQEPALKVIGASYGASLAETFSGRVQRVIRDHSGTLGYELEREAVDRWTTSAEGEYLASGVGGPIAGFRCDLAIIDDPIKSQEEADSERYRDRAWEWYLSDLRPRLRPGGRIVLIMTRWHEDDLAGRILLHAPGDWRVVKLPAIAEDDDPLGRERGAPLWADDPGYRYDLAITEARENYEKTGNLRAWYALYQQSPRALDGNLFRVDRLIFTSERLAPAMEVRAWDLGSTSAKAGRDPDWTVGVRLAKLPDGRLHIVDVVKLRGEPSEVMRAVIDTAQADGRSVRISLPQDPGQAGKMQAQFMARALLGFTVTVTPETGSKETRAMPFAAQVNAGNVIVTAGAAWTRGLVEEMRSFPSGKHDDQVDALSRAAGMLVTAAEPAKMVSMPWMMR